jgi:hypothetical protein
MGMPLELLYPAYGAKVSDYAQRLSANIIEIGQGQVKSTEIDSTALLLLADALCASRRNFPYLGGFDKASPFKKVAEFAVHFIEHAPIRSFEPNFKMNADLQRRKNYASVWYALTAVVTKLHGATINRKDLGTIQLLEPIKWSNHTLLDLYETLDGYNDIHAASTTAIAQQAAQRLHHQRYQLFALLIEQSAYRTNYKAMYPPGQPSP